MIPAAPTRIQRMKQTAEGERRARERAVQMLAAETLRADKAEHALRAADTEIRRLRARAEAAEAVVASVGKEV